MKKALSFPNAGRLLTVAALSLAGLAAHAQPTPGSLLQTYSPGGAQENTVWTDLSNSNPAYTPPWWNGFLAADTGSGNGTLKVLLDGYPATFGLYAWSDDFGLLVTESTTAFDIESVILQVEQMANPDLYYWDGFTTTGNALDVLLFNDPASPDYNLPLGLLLDDSLVTGYAGGPVLSYSTNPGGASPVVLNAAPVGFGLVNQWYDSLFDVTWASFAYQFDLSGLSGVRWVQVGKPSSVFEATTAAKISTNSAYTLVVP